ncbi:MAG: hypothetical protein IPP80_12455 [Ignavibacteria bacterium]|nr:hypothetical protein [Ignavibacteria bacterium]
MGVPHGIWEAVRIIGNHRYVGAGSRGYALVLDEYGHGLVITKANGTAQWIWSSGIVKINTWSHVSGVFDGTSLQVFINGVECSAFHPVHGDDANG